jgi:hypothetical protein
MPGNWPVRCAPRGALSHPWRSQEELEGRFLGQLAYLALKDNGDKSMPVKQPKPEDVYGEGLQDPHDMVKARLLEAQSPAGESDPPVGITSEADVVSCIGMNRETIQPSRDERYPTRVLKEISRPPTSCSDV